MDKKRRKKKILFTFCQTILDYSAVLKIANIYDFVSLRKNGSSISPTSILFLTNQLPLLFLYKIATTPTG